MSNSISLIDKFSLKKIQNTLNYYGHDVPFLNNNNNSLILIDLNLYSNQTVDTEETVVGG